MTQITGTGAGTLSYEYDGLGRRTGATVDSGSETERCDYLIAPAAQRLGLDMEVQHLATSAGATVGWIYAGENPIMRFEGAPGSATISYYLEDATDSIRAVLNAAGTVTEQYDYDAFGNPLTGSDVPTSATTGGEFGFHGAWRDAETGLYHMRARTYDPVTGRFTTPDPADGDGQVPETFEPYSFANNNPHLYTDPTGLFTLTEINVAGNFQRNLGRLKSVVAQQAKNYAKEEIEEYALEYVIDKLAKFLPGWGSMDPRPLFAHLTSGEIGVLFEEAFRDTVLAKILPFDGLWVHPTINPRTGKVKNAGLNKNNSDNEGGMTTYSEIGPKPDYLINRSDPSKRGAEKTWLIGDITLSENGLYKKYVSPGEQQTQWKAIVNHAKNYGLRISLFIAFYDAPGEYVAKALRDKIGKAALKDGAVIFILTLIDR